MSISGKWGYRVGEHYEGSYDTADEAAKATGVKVGVAVTVGQYRDPIPPEQCLAAGDIFERVLCQDDYEWAEYALECSSEQTCELEASLRKVFGCWLDKHGLRPDFGLVDKPQQIMVS